MKTKIAKYISFFTFAAFILTSCLDDLNTLPLDERIVVAERVYDTPEGYIGVIAKCYASLILTGQQGPGGDRDVPNIDEGYSGFTRALYYLQNACTDESAFQSGSGYGTRALLNMDWNANTQILSFAYYRLYITIKLCNEFIAECTPGKMKDRGVYDALESEYEYYIAEARLIRAYAYSVLIDLYGDVPYVDPEEKFGAIPQQKTRKELYEIVMGELEEIQNILKEPGKNEYGRVDRVAAWFLMARNALNAQTWIGVNEYQKAYEYAKKVIDSNAYPLASDYRHIFLADNNTCSEIIWPLYQDKDVTLSSAGTSFVIKAFLNDNVATHFPCGIQPTQTWGNARAKKTMVELFPVEDQKYDVTDPWGNNKGDKRAQFFSGVESDPTSIHSLETWTDEVNSETGAHQDFGNGFNLGYSILKWRNVNKNGSELEPGGTVYSSIDFPLFRTSDAYLMAAEALLRINGNMDEALGYVNEIRDRAYTYGKYETVTSRAVNGRITAGELTLDFICDERGREMHTELIRRTDLIRFGKFTKGYNWDWKGSGGAYEGRFGKDVDDKYVLFPIPADEFTSNPNLTQNPNFK